MIRVNVSVLILTVGLAGCAGPKSEVAYDVPAGLAVGEAGGSTVTATGDLASPSYAPATAVPAAQAVRKDEGKAEPDPSDLPVPDDDGDDPMRTTAGLGDPSRPGLWMETPLVTRKQPGRIVVVGTARAARVTLLPAGGPKTAGSRLSLEAMQVLNAPLTALVELDVYRGG